MELFKTDGPVPERRLEVFFTAGIREEGRVARRPARLAPICDCNGVSKG